MSIKKKSFRKIAILFGFIVCLSNICGLIIPDRIILTCNPSGPNNEWIQFLDDYRRITDPVQLLTFLVPTLLSVLYSFCPEEKIKSRLVNLPLVYSAIGISGWVTYFVEEIFLIIVAKNIGYHINARQILSNSFLTICLEAIVTFTMSFFIMESLHRKVFLPKYFPNGQISRLKGVLNPGTKLLFAVNYVSVTLFPIFYMFLITKSLMDQSNIEFEDRFYITIAFILFFGLMIFISFENYFDKPLRKLKRRVRQIKDGDLGSKVSIITNDAFGELGDIFNEMTDSIETKTQKIFDIQNSIITGMATMVESRDNSTGGHIKRTSDCIKVFVNRLKKEEGYSEIPDHFYDCVIKAAPMHDLGKIAVDDAVLRKPGKFTDEEYEKMKKHSEEGARIVENVLSAVDDLEFKKIAVNIAHYHHEKWNGQGYPAKISGEEIPLESRIMALADVFDALVSKRCYKDSFTYDKAFAIIQESLGTHFDPKLGKLFLECRSELEEMYVLFNGKE